MPLFTQSDVRSLHALVVKRSDPGIAGGYATSNRYVNTDKGRHTFPPPSEIPSLMGDFSAWLRAALRLVDIHPFNDGNGRAARLLMNLVLIRGGYPPVAVRPADRLAYLSALQEAQAGRSDEEFKRLLYQRLDAALEDYLSALREALAEPCPSRKPGAEEPSPHG
jgi:Fic family protein